MVGLHFDRLEARESAGLIAKMRRSINVISLASTGTGAHYSTHNRCPRWVRPLDAQYL